MGLLRRFTRLPVPPELRQVLAADETLLSVAEVEGGRLGVTRYGVWVLTDDAAPERIGWETVSKAHWDGSRLGLTVSETLGELGGAQLIRDLPRRVFTVLEPRKVTDIVHTRTRAGIVSSEHHDLGDGGGWLVLRRTPGRDGLTAQIRLDLGTDPTGLGEPVSELVQAALGDRGPR